MSGHSALDPDRISVDLQTQWLGKRVVVFDRTASTNDVAAAYAGNPRNHGLVVLAEQQSAGRGRGVNTWQAGYGQSILASLVMIDQDLSAGLLSLTAAVAVAQTLGPRARIKWPNDVLIRGKKVCGLLVERRAFAGHIATILGMGLNCHQQEADFPEDLRATAISLDMAGPGHTDRVLLMRRLLVEFEFQFVAAHVRPDTIVDQWKQRSVQLGHRVVLQFNGQRFAGQCLGVEPEDGLVLKLDHGGVRHFPAAQTHVIRE